MTQLSKDSINYLVIDDNAAGQRLDNFLFTALKGVPKSHIYLLIRQGEIRIMRADDVGKHGKRSKQTYHLQLGDTVRIAPIRVAEPNTHKLAVPAANFPIIYEDESILVINKPAGVAVHGGSGVSFGVIEQLRQQHPDWKFLELAHRLDRETSGVLILAKKRAALLRLQALMQDKQTDKRYYALVQGQWLNSIQHLRYALHKYTTPEGERRVRVQADGQVSHTVVRLEKRYAHYSLVEAQLKTGRTHQIRVHLASAGFPIVNDEKYGDYAANKILQKTSFRNMFLHAHRLQLPHPIHDTPLDLVAPLPPALAAFLAELDETKHG
jgi:23S rRNA pseudouridine955/2504/2580 synthase